MLARPSANTARVRTPVVPASRAITQASVTDGECTGHPPAGHAFGGREPVSQRTLRRVRVGMLTGGGDCPGLNAVIRAVVRIGERVHGDEMIGFLDAWDGVHERRTCP